MMTSDLSLGQTHTAHFRKKQQNNEKSNDNDRKDWKKKHINRERLCERERERGINTNLTQE